ncbi:unnamed protein product [Sphenostylis stenocarpa]|uniref:Uncharacterized protein n=1 Tax=Sphenostylis stenocarpa TaxID=92480 RepID=A0AA86VFU1_9FABA|nr:unnamed protein product [Sphenostylis stenocarpa]
MRWGRKNPSVTMPGRSSLLSPVGNEDLQVGSKVEVLPGFEGPLPFELETGNNRYVGLGETDDDMQVFYFFIKSENDPAKDPLILWLTGGPGCSSISALVLQIGPLAFKIEEYNGSLPNLILKPQSWTKASSIIFVDLPLGSGFSYAKNVTAHRSDWKLVHHTHQFLRKWLIDHPDFISNEFYMGGDSYSGIPSPAIVQEISKGIHWRKIVKENLYLKILEVNRAQVISITIKRQCLSRIDTYYILDSYFCKEDTLKKNGDMWRRSLTQKFESSLNYQLVPDKRCKTYTFFLLTQWANDESVRKALHLREGTTGRWQRCNSHGYEYEISSSFEFHVNLSAKGYRSLIYSGDHDAAVSFMSTQAWIRALNYSIVDDWRPWLLEGQVAGYTRTYSNQMTFATVKGSGHTASVFKPDECLAMFTRWITNKSL